MRCSVTAFVTLLLLSRAPHIDGRRSCGTPEPTESKGVEVGEAISSWSANNRIERKTVNVPTYWNTVTNSTTGYLSDETVRKSIAVLNDAFKPHFEFTLVDDPITTTNLKYWDFSIGHEAEYDMKNDLRKGGCGSLNIYSTELKLEGLGWSSLPNECDPTNPYDGAVIDYGSVVGGFYEEFNEGDNLVHMVGHWLGLYHTFHNGCKGNGDDVDDTPAVKTPNYSCDKERDSCPKDGLGNDMLENFMDYTEDSCMTKFTPGQFDRMNKMWNIYRSDEKTPPPTPSPTPSPPCPDPKDVRLEVEVRPGFNHFHKSFYVLKKNKKGYNKKNKLLHMKIGSLEMYSTNIVSKCVRKNRQYRFLIFDRKEDGYGNGFIGDDDLYFYKITCNGRVIKKSSVFRETVKNGLMDVTTFKCK